VGALEHGPGDVGLGEDRRNAEEDAEDRIGDGEGGDEDRQGLGDEELFAADGGDENRLEGALLAFADDGVCGEDRRHHRRDHEHVQQRKLDMRIELGAAGRAVDKQELDRRQDHEQERQGRHGEDDEPVAPVVPQLLAEERADPAPAEPHRRFASTSSSTSLR
jgi:hypothetical protein